MSETKAELIKNYDTQKLINSILQISLEPLSLKEQLEAILTSILSIHWLALEQKGSIFLVEDESDALIMKAQLGLAPALLTKCARLPFGVCLCGQAALTKTIVFTNCITDLHNIGYPEMHQHGHYCIPIMIADRVVGVINLYVKHEHVRDEVEINFLSAAAKVVASITVKKLQEDKLKEYNRKLEETSASLMQSNDEIKSLTHIISHDLRGPMVNLSGFSSELKTALQQTYAIIDKNKKSFPAEDFIAIDCLKQDMDEAVKFIESSTIRVNNLGAAVLKLCNLGRQELVFEDIDMNILVQNLINSMAWQININNTKIIISDLPVIKVDKTSIELIMENIINNAIKYLDPNRLGIIEISSTSSPISYIFCVKDNGRGISPDSMDKVFKMFKRAGCSDIPGDGVGLAFVKAIIGRHGGQIWCESKYGIGSAFRFTIPF
jgi:signal transduction histidine kinase